MIEIKERELIIEDYRKKLISVSDKFENLTADHDKLLDDHRKLRENHDIIEKRYSLLRKVSDTLSNKSLKEFEMLNDQ